MTPASSHHEPSVDFRLNTLLGSTHAYSVFYEHEISPYFSVPFPGHFIPHLLAMAPKATITTPPTLPTDWDPPPQSSCLQKGDIWQWDWDDALERPLVLGGPPQTTACLPPIWNATGVYRGRGCPPHYSVASAATTSGGTPAATDSGVVTCCPTYVCPIPPGRLAPRGCCALTPEIACTGFLVAWTTWKGPTLQPRLRPSAVSRDTHSRLSGSSPSPT